MQVQDDKPYDDINITPMLDLAYVLLVIFILMCTATVQGIKAKVPQGSNAPKAKKAEKIQSIAITAENKILLNGVTPEFEVTLVDLEARLAQARAQNPKVQVIVKGDGAAQHQAVVEVLALVTQTGITQVGLATSSAAAKP